MQAAAAYILILTGGFHTVREACFLFLLLVWITALFHSVWLPVYDSVGWVHSHVVTDSMTWCSIFVCYP